ncbi:transcription initiation factor IID, 31kD subunit-domain-containing protein [Radiomyces spectabilis]|uniref:transcription initiation factor IID, 31kD subunit-domain-containing protein n=1 Tax=Radiomyces spectabilis TaxID=64574 RepID=UPI00221E8137|nr:transcription initiation factor IID, 31kD subunit-domain-containing protein [Radiomyces spectabilis]KAI8379403.1 transcription initiation factor IID, 31kD subunit-domain-containing protein [Radiomyces spectabilis]
MAIESPNYPKDQQQPRDARIVSLILQSLGVQDYDPKVVHQLLEFAHRYTSDVFQDALVYAEHANKSDIDLEDIQLAIQGRVNHSFTTPPPKEFLLELAREKNKAPLPLIPEKYGIRLPADKHCLTGINFSIVPDAPPPPRAVVDKPAPVHEPTSETADVTMIQAATPPSQSEAASKRKRHVPEEDDYDI